MHTNPLQAQDLRRPRHSAVIAWDLAGPDFAAGQYSRVHRWSFDGGQAVTAGPSPHVVPEPWSQPAAVDPEEAFVASIASCHMLTFLWVASRAGWIVRSYRDQAFGIMTKNERRVPWVSHVVLRPEIEWSDERTPTPDELRQLHDQAHDQCFIANSVLTEIHVERPGFGDPAVE